MTKQTQSNTLNTSTDTVCEIGALPINNGEAQEPSAPENLWLLRNGTAKKVSKYADGNITYQVLADADRSAIFIAITGNDGGGYFSRERVPFDAVETCLSTCDTSKPFPSKSFQTAFVGRSSNNAGFLVAVLRAEDLLCQAPDHETQHAVAGDWTAWKKAALAEPGTLIEIACSAASAIPATVAETEHSEHKKTLKLPGKKKA